MRACAPVSCLSGFFRRAAIVIGLSVCLAVALPPAGRAQQSDGVALTLDQVRGLASDALNSGDPGLAIQLAKGLLKADPKDPLAYYIIASGYAQLNDPTLSRRAAALAYRYSPPGPDRYQAAQLAARAAFEGKRYSLSQLWLRRTAIHAPTEQDELLVARDYKLLRRVNPWSLRIRTDLRPSNNVNNGSDTSLNIIDGVPDGGTIDGAGLALSGLIGSLDLAPTYRLRINETSATYLGARLYIERVALSSDAKSLAPSATGSDFASTYGELSLSHAFAVGPKEKGGSAEVSLALGDSWYGGERSYQFARLQGERNWTIFGDSRIALRADAEQRYRARYSSNDARILGLGAEFGKALNNGDVLSVALALRDTNAQSVNGTYTSASMRTNYTLGRAVGPARLSMGLVLGYTQYDSYIASVFIPPTQRTDKSVYGDVTFIFDKYDYAGFVPTLRLRTGRKKSNFSRFSSRELSLSVGVGSKF